MLILLAWSFVASIPKSAAHAAEPSRTEDVYAFGDAPFFGSTGSRALTKPIVGMASSPSGRGYWFVATDGGIFSFGDAEYHGSMSGDALAQPVVSMDATPTGNGYWLAAADGGVFGFGDATVARPLTAMALPRAQHVIDVAVAPVGHGYWLASARTLSAKAEGAIAWYMSRVGQPVYQGQCELAIENAYGTESVYATAASNWQAQPVKHLDWQNAPPGALVFWDTGPNGHVAISLGNGRVASSSVDGHIGIVTIDYFQNPLGWTDSPFH